MVPWHTLPRCDGRAIARRTVDRLRRYIFLDVHTCRDVVWLSDSPRSITFLRNATPEYQDLFVAFVG